jgi:hypothetical protein
VTDNDLKNGEAGEAKIQCTTKRKVGIISTRLKKAMIGTGESSVLFDAAR